MSNEEEIIEFKRLVENGAKVVDAYGDQVTAIEKVGRTWCYEYVDMPGIAKLTAINEGELDQWKIISTAEMVKPEPRLADTSDTETEWVNDPYAGDSFMVWTGTVDKCRVVFRELSNLVFQSSTDDDLEDRDFRKFGEAVGIIDGEEIDNGVLFLGPTYRFFDDRWIEHAKAIAERQKAKNWPQKGDIIWVFIPR